MKRTLKLTLHLAATAFALSSLEQTDPHTLDKAVCDEFAKTGAPGEDYPYFKQEFTSARARFIQLNSPQTFTVSETKARQSAAAKPAAPKK